jgi:transcriptional regulator with XRE-family HTH domain
MGTLERSLDRGSRRGLHWLTVLGNEYRAARLTAGTSQREVARAAHLARSPYQRVEHGIDPNLTVIDACRLAAVLGLDIYMRVYSAGQPVRDAGQARLLKALLANVMPPLRYRIEVPLPRNDERPEYRAWDAVVWGRDQRTAIELETRLYDIQAQVRAFRLKLRDDPPEHFLLVVAHTRTNRRVIADFPELLADCPRQRTASVLATLRRGEHPPTGLVLL